jgi:seryl-tRNA synthetase
MIDLKFLRENPDVVRDSQRTRGEDPSLVDQLLEADQRRRDLIAAADTSRSEAKAYSRSMGTQMKDATPEEREQLKAKGKELAEAVRKIEADEKIAEQDVHDLQFKISNIVTGAPAGGEDDFVVLEHIGTPREFDFEPKDHLELGESLGLIDMERGAKVSGARFYFLTGDGALLQLAMLQLAARKAVEHGFQLMIPPVLVRPEIMAGTGFLGAHADEIYHLDEDDLFLVGTSEVALAGYHSDEIIDLSEGPV